jgi:hypothetical protein
MAGKSSGTIDIWQKTGGWYDINEYIQEKREFVKHVRLVLEN